ncbi:MAG TPA: TonB-dependent receptor [Methylomusa anaerophila]|uniref:Colicin I receptor n=1 Tax=Methylomusa anaerophila TaxID=1930071 RepID=A0A348AFD3_9FIRM|nr:TonB-dependent receptor [Methylomusa anaerophila]BBB89781.1 colicin I receptor precursor [Methylomusa anaerophila]HML89173.1 TonB-dependent receptor [Methylomusa anaerophila]
MDKKIIRNLAIFNCFLLMLPGLAFAAESSPAPSDTTLEEVVVNATPLEKYLVTTSVITDKDIKAKGAQNLAQALEDVPGLNLHRGKKNAETVDIRGSQLTYTKIYIDGVFVNPFAKVSRSATVDLNMFPVENIAKIEIIKGPAPVAYGTDAIGGIILITTKNGKDYPGGNVSVVGGSNGTLNGSVSYGGGNDKFNYFINAGSVHNDGYDSESNATLKTQYFNTKLNWKFQDNSSLSFIGGYSTTDSGASLQMYDPYGKQVSSTSGFWPGLNNWQYRDWEKTQLVLDYDKKVDSKFDYNFKVYRYTESQGLWANGGDYDRSLVGVPGGVRLSGNIAGNGGNAYDITRWNASLWDTFLNGWEFKGNWKLDSKHTLTFGTMYNNIGWKSSSSPSTAPNDPNNYNWVMTNSNRFDYYLQDNITPNDRTTVTLGIRHDRNKLTNADLATDTVSSTDPTVNVVYQLDNRNTLRASYGQTCSFPLLSQLFGANGTPDLKPEKAKNYELGLKHQFDENTTGDIAIFRNDITDKIGSDPGNPQKSINLAWARIKGVELNLNKKISPRWSSFFNYTYLDTAAVYQNSDGTTYTADLTYTPKNHINYGVDYQAGKGYTLSLTGHWVPSDRFTNDTGANDNRTTVNGQKPVYSYLSGYHTLDFQVKRQINDKQDWYVTIYNVFDAQYDDELFFPAQGRTVLVGSNFKF